VNVTSAQTALTQLSTLHAVLSIAGGASKAEAVGRQLRGEVTKLQQAARTELQTLGIYRQHSNVSRTAVLTWQGVQERMEQRTILLAMDRLWWELRGKLDNYMDAAETEVDAFQKAFATMAAYEHCSTALPDVMAEYGRSMAAMDYSHRSLKATWRDSMNIVGELAAVIQDGDVFATLVSQEGCKSPLAHQTMKQARFAVGGLKLLLHRFKVGGLGQPEVGPLVDAVQRIQSSFRAVMEGCPK